MTTDPLFLATFDGELGTDPAGNRTLSGLVVPFNVPTTRYGTEIVFTKDTTRLPEDLATVKLCVNHDTDRPAGFGASATVGEDGVHMTFSVPTSVPRSAELLLDVDSKLRDGLSVGFTPDPETMAAIFARAFGEDTGTDPVPFAGVIREVSATAVPQFNEARLDTSSTPALVTFQRPERSPMTVTTELPAAPDAHALPTFSMEELAAELAPFLGSSHAVHPLARFTSLSDFVMAGREGSVTPEELAAFVLADQITSDNPGVMRPAWIDGIVGILNRGRPAISAFGGPGSAGDSGMRVEWPIYTGGFDDLVGVQANEKTEVTTRKVSILKDGADLATYAGASDISYQLLRRSSPSYREAYSRILAIAYGIVTDAKFSADLVAGATGTGSWDGTLPSLTNALFAASDAVDTAVGVPADVVLAAPDVFLTIGSLEGLKPPVYGTSNIQGTSQASTLRVNVSGLEVRKGRNLAAGSLLVASSEAAQWLEDGPFPIEADDVPKLGRDVGIWGMGTTRLTVPAGVVNLTTTTPPAELARSSK